MVLQLFASAAVWVLHSLLKDNQNAFSKRHLGEVSFLSINLLRTYSNVKEANSWRVGSAISSRGFVLSIQRIPKNQMLLNMLKR